MKMPENKSRDFTFWQPTYPSSKYLISPKLITIIRAIALKTNFHKKSGLAPTTHLPTHPLGFLGGWVVQKTQKNPLLSKNH
jgi:hypothetical protein